ncbi:MAG: hypothetical protein OXS33_03340 [bacterium]|nr:hypothetical protein [bacterium]
MAKNPSLADALQAFDRRTSTESAAADPSPSSHQRKSAQPPSRRGKKALIGYFNPSVSKQLKQIALDEDSSVQHLLGEAIDLLFQVRGKPMIARERNSR